MTVILKALVGSRAHGLHTPESDYDYRGVHVTPTAEILSLGYKYKATSWLEGDVDETSYEIGHFLQLCTKANPSVLEVLISQDVEINTPYADEMRKLLPYMYTPKEAFDAFAGYSKNQQKKLLEGRLDRPFKYGVAYVRTAYNLCLLLNTGSFSLKVRDEYLKIILQKIKAGEWTEGQIIDQAEQHIEAARQMVPNVENKQDLKRVNDFLLKVRKDFL